MGIYVNPTNGKSKEVFLMAHGKYTTFTSVCDCPPDYINTFPVVLVDNGPFTAAAVITEGLELTSFFNPMDNRPKELFLVTRENLLSVGLDTGDKEAFIAHLKSVDPDFQE